MRKPPLRAYNVANPKEGSTKKVFWHEVGIAWPHKNGVGVSIDIHEGISVSGRIVLATPKAAAKKLSDPGDEAWAMLSE